MRLRSLLAIALTCATSTVYFVGCGDDDESKPTPTTDAGPDGDATTNDVTEPPDTGGQTDGPVVDGDTCKPNGQACASSTDCCSVNCNSKTGLCEKELGPCGAKDESCTTGNECCTQSCVGGKCSGTQCTSDTEACTTNEQCCSGTCSATTDGGAKTCKPLNTNCDTAGNKCTTNAECCSKVCQGGICQGQPSFCTQTGDRCTTNFECCGGVCNKAAGAIYGLCEVVSAPGTSGCLVTGQVCGEAPSLDDGGVPNDAGIPTCGGACCSRACGPYGTSGISICQPPSGCRPTGETCREGADCCGFGGTKNVTGEGSCSIVDDAGIGRCDNGNGCRPAGAICKLASTSCNAENNCCAGNVNNNPLVCQQDILGIPRCTTVGNCADAGSKQGLACASSADCCGLPCVPNNAAANPPFICGGSCVGLGGACTTSGDCCTGIPCVQLPGSTNGICGGELPPPDAGPDAQIIKPDGGDSGTPPGTCALAGQQCSVDGDCCNSSVYKCRSGTCRIPIQ